MHASRTQRMMNPGMPLSRPEPVRPARPKTANPFATPTSSAPWHCAEYCAQKWSQPGTFPEYQNCLDTCRRKWPSRFTSGLPPVDPGGHTFTPRPACPPGQYAPCDGLKNPFIPGDNCSAWGPCAPLPIAIPRSPARGWQIPRAARAMRR